MKKLLAALFIVFLAATAYAADTKLSALTELAAAPAESDEIYINDGGVSKKISVLNFMGALEGSMTDFAIHADNLPDLSATYQPTAAALTSLSGLTETQGAIVYTTADNTYTILAKGTAAQLLQMNAGATAPEWTSTISGSFDIGDSVASGHAVTMDANGVLQTAFGALLPDSAGGADIGSASYEWGDVYLKDGAVIKGQADQSNTLTSSATGWTANLNFVVTGQLSGRVPVVSDADGKTLSGTDLYGSMQLATGAGTWTIPDVDSAAGTGQCFCVYATGAYEIIIAGDAEDKIRLNGTLGAAGGDITNNTAEAAGDFICLMLTDFATDVAHWTTLGYKGTWTVVP